MSKKNNGDIYFGYTGKISDVYKKYTSRTKNPKFQAPRPLLIIKNFYENFYIVAKCTSSKKYKTYEFGSFLVNPKDSFILHESMFVKTKIGNFFKNPNWNVVSNKAIDSFFKIYDRFQVYCEIIEGKFEKLSIEEVKTKLYMQYTKVDRELDQKNYEIMKVINTKK